MKFLIIILAAFGVSCTNKELIKTAENDKSIKVRVTYYSIGEDKWGDRIASCPKSRAKMGITAAADPKIFPFGTKIIIDDPNIKKIFKDPIFIVQDTGKDVKRQKASNRTAPVIDLFVSSRRMIKAIENKIPHYLNLKIFN